MAVIQIVSFMIIVFLLAYIWREDFVTVLPCAVCGLVLLLYVFALCRCLSLIDWIQAGVPVAVCLWLFFGKRREVLAYWRGQVMQPSFFMAVLMLFIVSVCVSGRVVTWWDDINYWAADVKSLYYLDGFAAKYGNVSPEFGDYPPGAQLMKWWFAHMDRRAFREGMAFAGYYAMNLSFLLPLLKRLKGKNIVVMALMAIALWLFPGIAEVYGYQGFCADLTMACIYGGFLYGVTDREGHKGSFYYIRLALYLSVLVMVKSVGFIWAAFGLIFLYLHEMSADSRENKEGRKKHFLCLSMVTLAPVISGVSWLTFCLLMRRVTNTTATAVKYITTDDYSLSGYRNEFAKAFVQAFFLKPLHQDKSWGIDLTPFMLYLCICLIVIFLYRRKIIPGRQGRLILWFSIVSGMVFYAVIFLAHLTIFATETQYLEASGMISSIERYGAPFTVGTLLFLSFLWIEHGDKLFAGRRPLIAQYGTFLCFIGLTFLAANWRRGYDALIGYRGTVEEALSAREAMVDDRGMNFLDTIKVLGSTESTRVLCLQEDDSVRWVGNSYTSMAASPVSVVYKGVNLESASGEWLAGEIRASHASYLYLEETDADAAAVFADMMTEGKFETQSLYRIEDDKGVMRLHKAEEGHGY